MPVFSAGHLNVPLMSGVNGLMRMMLLADALHRNDEENLRSLPSRDLICEMRQTN